MSRAVITIAVMFAATLALGAVFGLQEKASPAKASQVAQHQAENSPNGSPSLGVHVDAAQACRDRLKAEHPEMDYATRVGTCEAEGEVKANAWDAKRREAHDNVLKAEAADKPGMELADMVGMAPPSGKAPYVGKITPGSLADKAGLLTAREASHEMWWLEAVNGVRTQTVRAAREALSTSGPLAITIWEHNVRKTVTLRPASPASQGGSTS